MTTRISRRDFLAGVGAAGALGALFGPFAGAIAAVPATHANAWAGGRSNFHGIYDEEALRERFLLFLQNVYSIYPPEKFHALILETVRRNRTDREIYLAGQSRLGDVKPFAGDIFYALPALFRQTSIVGDQIADLLKGRKQIDGYMEIGSKGGYVARVGASIKVGGDVVLLNTEPASYGPLDILERRSVLKAGRFVSLNNYLPIASTDVASGSLDVVCNPIGFHHSPPELRDEFVRSVRRCLRQGGELIVRDHDVSTAAMNHMVALAHDVFNMGLKNPWDYNQKEIRNFTSLAELVAYLQRFGFRATGKVLYQEGDPTRNALFSFVAV